jgi:hypothetical protein
MADMKNSVKDRYEDPLEILLGLLQMNIMVNQELLLDRSGTCLKEVIGLP